MEIKKAIITAAGFGSRFLPITKSFPKELLPIVDKPIIHYLVEECQEAGIEEVIIVASPSEINTFENYFYGRATDIRTLMIRQGKLERWSKVEKVFNLPLITIIPEDRRLAYGNGRPILSAKDLVSNEEAFVVMFGDDLVLSEVSSVKQLIDRYMQDTPAGLIAVQEMPRDQLDRYGIVKPFEGSEDRLEDVIEKPSNDEAPSNLANFGRYIITPKVFEYLSAETTGKDGEIWLMDAIQKLAKSGSDIRFTKIKGEWLTTGDPLRYVEAQIKFSLANKNMRADLIPFLKQIINEFDKQS